MTSTRRITNTLFIACCYAAAGLVVAPLLFILGHLLGKGLGGVNWAFFTHMPKPVGELGGGMANAIVGTLLIVGVAAAIALPIGIAAGVYLAE